jgi:hypothetical protein
VLRAPALTDSGAHTDVSLACTATDTTSGLTNSANASFSLSSSVPVSTETNNASSGARTVSDMAGNSATAGPIGGNMVDTKPATISVSAPVAGTTCSDRRSPRATAVVTEAQAWRPPQGWWRPAATPIPARLARRPSPSTQPIRFAMRQPHRPSRIRWHMRFSPPASGTTKPEPCRAAGLYPSNSSCAIRTQWTSPAPLSSSAHASHHVVAAVALMKSYALEQGKRLTNPEIVYILKNTSGKVDTACATKAPAGLINLTDAFKLLQYELN